MKRVCILIVAILTLCSCGNKPKVEHRDNTGFSSSGVWVSYSELNSMLTSERGFIEEFEDVLENLKSFKIENLYFHVRAFCDSVYKSEYYPLMSNAVSYDFDILEYVINRCHESGIKIHAWINPYRISNSLSNVEELDKLSPAYRWTHDQNTENDRNVCVYNGIYLNPAEIEVQKLVVDGIREILEKYDVDGIHFDDYFYPTQSEEFDRVSYETYINENTFPLELASWRRLNVDLLLSGTYNAIKHIKRDVIFSVSPAASVENNFQSLYADVRTWVDNGFVDAIIPQLYFGFDYPDDSFKFETLLTLWQDVCALNPDVKLYIGLAFYKSKPTLSADIPEWQQNGDIIKRQVELLDGNQNTDGYVYFSYSSLTSSEAEFKTQRESLTDYLKKRD